MYFLSKFKQTKIQSDYANEIVSDSIAQKNISQARNFENQQRLSQNKQNNEFQSSRKPLSTWLYLLFCNTFFMLGMNMWFLVFFTIEIPQLQSILFAIQSVISSLICGVTIYILNPSLKQSLRLFFLLDQIFINMIITGIAFTHQIFILDAKDEWTIKLYLPFFYLESFFMVTALKVVIINMRWTKWKVIMMKGLMLYLAITFFYFGVYYIQTRKSFVKIEDEKIQQKMNGFQILYVFSAFSNFLESYKKISSFDGTEHFRYDYLMREISPKRIQRRKQMIFNRRETFNTLLSLKQRQNIIQKVKKLKKSRFSQNLFNEMMNVNYKDKGYEIIEKTPALDQNFPVTFQNLNKK